MCSWAQISWEDRCPPANRLQPGPEDSNPQKQAPLAEGRPVTDRGLCLDSSVAAGQGEGCGGTGPSWYGALPYHHRIWGQEGRGPCHIIKEVEGLWGMS